MFKDKLKEIMFKNNLTQNDVAEIINSSQKTVSNWLNGKGNPRVAELQKLSDKFDINITWWNESVSENEQKEVLILDLINELVDAGIIKDKNNIPLSTLELLVATIKIMTKKEK